MDKYAALEQIYGEAFDNELDKLAAGGFGKVVQSIKSLPGKGKDLAKSLSKKTIELASTLQGKAVGTGKAIADSVAKGSKSAAGFSAEVGKEMGRSAKSFVSHPLGAATAAGTAGLVGGIMSERYGANLQKENKKRNFGQWLITPTINPKTGNTYYMKRK